MTYRAAYYQTPDGQEEIVLSDPSQSHLDEETLRAQACAEARESGLIGPEEHQITEAQFRAGLLIGQWQQKDD